MRSIYTRIFIIALLATTVVQEAIAGNEDRAGESGAYELLIDGWGRNAGFMSMNTSRTMGVEAMRLNVGGLAFVEKTEVAFSYTRWLEGSDVNVIHGGFAQKLGADNVLGLSIQSLSFGEIERTTTANPEGGIGTFSPRFINIGLGFSRAFSNSIYAGATVRMVSEQAGEAGAAGIALDAGIQYVTGKMENIRFGVSIRNLGTPMSFSGTGFGFRGDAPEGNFDMTLQQRGAKFNLPTQLNIGASYDIYLGSSRSGGKGDTTKVVEVKDDEAKPAHRVTILGNFTSNSVGKDFMGLGLEYAFIEMIMVRAGYRYQQDIFSSEDRTDAHLGFSGGVSFEYEISKKGQKLGIDYAYRFSNPYKGTHSIGLRFNL